MLPATGNGCPGPRRRFHPQSGDGEWIGRKWASPVESGLARGDGPTFLRPVAERVTVNVRTYDDGAWVSVNDDRRVGTGELWRVDDPALCGCRPADLLVEGYVAVGVDGPTVATRVHGRCIGCGAAATTDWLPVGRVRAGTFRRLADGAVRRPLPADG